MSIIHEKICRLCLNVVTGKFEEIGEVMRQMLHILLLKLDLKVTRNPIICWGCVEIAKKCLKFKLTCSSTERIILLFSADKDTIRDDIKVIYKENQYIETAVDDDFEVCRICMIRLERSSSFSSDPLRNEMTMFKTISGYLPEMDINIINNPISCTTCRGNLKCFSKFVLNCLNTEEKIKAFCKEEKTDRMDELNLGNLLTFLFKDTFEHPHPEKYPQTCTIKEEVCLSEGTQLEKLIKPEELVIKEEIDLEGHSYKILPEMGLKKLDKETVLDTFSLKTKDHNSKKCTYGNKVQANMVDSWYPGDALEVNEKETPDMRIEMCTEEKIDLITSTAPLEADINKYTLHKFEIKERSVLTHNINLHEGASGCREGNSNSSDKLYKCSWCAYKAKQRHTLKRHMLIHKDVSELTMHKCQFCAFETKLQDSLKRHMLVHKDVSELKMYKCPSCNHEAKEKYKLKSHMLVHKDVSEIQMHKCSLCAYETKRKHCLEVHMLVHKDASEIPMYKCSLCVYEAKYKSSLKSHMLIHKDISEIKMQKCTLCAYEFKYKSSLRWHMLAHRDASEIQTHKCPCCAFETKLRSSLKRHMVVHKDVSELKMYKCTMCAYETKHNASLTNHMLVHKDVSEIKMHKCSLCDYEAKYKSSLKKHILVHKDVSEIEMHKCSLCSYKAKQKSSLKNHMLVHKDVSEIEMYKCLLCGYEAKHKNSIKKHLIRHNELSQTAIHKCSLCGYKAKQQRGLTRHMSVHKNVSEIKMHGSFKVDSL